MRPQSWLLSLPALLLFGAAPASAQLDDIWRAGARVNVTASEHENVWAAGAIVSVRGSVRNDIRAAGAELDVDAAANGSMWAAGAIVAVRGTAARDINVAGARVSVDAEVGGELSVIGARVLVGPQTVVAGKVRLAGADVTFAGAAKGPAEFYGDTITIAGQVAGDVLVRARSVTVASGAIVEGNIVFETLDEPRVEPGATIAGRQTVTLPRFPRIETRHIFGAMLVMTLFAIGAGLVLGLILLAAARPFVERSIDAMRTAPLLSVLTGLAVTILAPILAVLVMVTVIGIPIGLVLLLAFPLAMVTATVLAAFGLADWIMNRQQEERSFVWRLLMLLVGLVILTLVGLIPVLGFLVWLLALLIGLGALWRAMRHRPEIRVHAAPHASGA